MRYNRKSKHLNTAARNALITSIMDIGKESYFENEGPTQTSSVKLMVIKFGFIEGGAEVFLRYCHKTVGTLFKDFRFQTDIQCVFANVAFGLKYL